MKDHRVYLWIPSKEVVFFQSLLDAQEGLARCRTERSEGEKSLLLVMMPDTQRQEFSDFARQFQQEYGITLDIV